MSERTTAPQRNLKVPGPPALLPTDWPWGGFFLHLVVIFFLLGIGILADLWQTAVLWGLYLAVLVLLVYRGGGRFLGPLFFYDLVRTSRHGRHIFLRCVYALVLLFVLFSIYTNRFAGRARPFDLFSTVSLRASELPEFAASFFSGFLIAQMAAVFLLTPAYTAGAIADERERRTFDFLLTTHLTDREIVLGMLASRMSHLVLLLLAGLPVLGIMQVMGGVDPGLVAAGFAATAATLFSVGSLSILISVLTRRPLAAMFRTYIWIAMFLTVGACVPPLNFGHPILAVERLRTSLFSAPGTVSTVTDVATSYVLTHVVCALVLLLIAVAQLRPASRRLVEPPPKFEDEPPYPGAPQPEPFAPLRVRPRARDNALLWKEMYVEQEFRWERVHPVMAVLLLFAGVCTAAVGLTIVVVGLSTGLGVAEPMNVWMQVVGTTICCLICVVVGFYAAGSISRERERQTLDSLLTLPESTDAVLQAKWLGSLLSVRQIYPLLGLVYGLALLTGGLHFAALPLLAVAAVSYVAFVASLGLYFSVICSSTLRATVCTLVTVAVLVGGLWLFSANSRTLLAWWLGPEAAELVGGSVFYGLTPPMPLLVLSFPLFALGEFTSHPTFFVDPLVALAGSLVYGAAAWVLRRLALWRMRATMG